MSDLIERAKEALEGATKGSWIAEDYTEDARVPLWFVIPPDHHGTIARLDYSGKAIGDMEANARLIALSPDLARALIAETERRERIEKAATELAEAVYQARLSPMGIPHELVDAYARFRAIAEGRE